MGDTTFVIDSEGQVWNRGDNRRYQLGRLGDSDVFGQIELDDHIMAVTPAQKRTLLLNSKQEVLTCGAVREMPQRNEILTPTKIEGLPPIISMACSDETSLFIDDQGLTWLTGLLNSGGRRNVYSRPIQVDAIPPSTNVAANWYCGVFLGQDRQVRLWYSDIDEIVTLSLPPIEAIASCGNNLALLDDQERVWRTMTVYEQVDPILVDGVPPIKAMTSGSIHNLLLDHDGKVWGLGSNYAGAIGRGRIAKQDQWDNPQIIAGLPPIVSMSAGENHSIFLDDTDALWGCGYNNHHQLSQEATEIFYTPIELSLVGHGGFYLNQVPARRWIKSALALS
jgi:alpha-tubulin suppressor-like RCC1 family protein